MQILNLKQCPEYIPQLAEWHFAEWSYLHPEMTIEMLQQKMHDYLNADFLPSMFVMLIDGNVQGSSSIVADDLALRPDLTPWLANVYVNATQRGQGLGKQLVVHAMQEAQQAGLPELYLFTADQQAFYSELGWRVVDMVQVENKSQTIMRYAFIP